MDQLLDSERLAELCDVPKRTLDQWAYMGTGPRYIRIGRHRRYLPSDVQTWLEAHAVETGHDVRGGRSKSHRAGRQTPV